MQVVSEHQGLPTVLEERLPEFPRHSNVVRSNAESRKIDIWFENVFACLCKPGENLGGKSPNLHQGLCLGALARTEALLHILYIKT